MRDEPVRLGFFSLLLLVVVLCLAVLSVLSFATARADLALAQKQAEVQQEVWALEAQGEQWLARVEHAVKTAQSAAALPGLLPEGTTLSDGTASVTLENGSRRLYAAVRLEALEITAWRQTAVWEADSQPEKLWGN